MNTDIYPPSRLLSPTDGSVQGSTGATVGSDLPAAGSTNTTGAGSTGVSGSSNTTSDQSQLNQTGPLGTNVQTNQNSLGIGTTTDPSQGTTQSTTGQNNTMGFNAQGGASNQLQQIEPNAQTSSSSSITGRTGRNSMTVTVNDCIKLWDNKTHMSRSEWSDTCKRVQNHLNNVITD